MKDEKQKALLNDIKTSDLKLPDIKRINIYNVSDSHTNLSCFLSNCAPNQLKYLCINHSTFADTLIKSKIDINSLSKTVAAVTKEIFIRLYEFSAADLQQFVRAACSAERIIIHRCSVHCSSALDFGSELKYNTNFLSFQFWGYTSYTELTTDWKTDPPASPTSWMRSPTADSDTVSLNSALQTTKLWTKQKCKICWM